MIVYLHVRLLLVLGNHGSGSQAGTSPGNGQAAVYTPTLHLISNGAHFPTALDLARGFDPFELLPAASLFTQLALTPHCFPPVKDPTTALGAANAFAYVVQERSAESLCGGKSKPVQLFESIGVRMPSCKPLTASRALLAISLFMGAYGVRKIFASDIERIAGPKLQTAAAAGPQPFVRYLRPALETEATRSKNVAIQQALLPRLAPLLEDLFLAGLVY